MSANVKIIALTEYLRPAEIISFSLMLQTLVCACACTATACERQIHRGGGAKGAWGGLTQVYNPSVFLLNSSLEIAADIRREEFPHLWDKKTCSSASEPHVTSSSDEGQITVSFYLLSDNLLMRTIASLNHTLRGKKTGVIAVNHVCITLQSRYTDKKIRNWIT